MNTNNLKIENNGITSIILHGYIRHMLVEKLVKVNSDKKITIWQNADYYFPCDRCKLTMGTNLKELFIDYHDFDLLIINAFVEWCNAKEIIEFLKYIKTSPLAKDKKIVIIFSLSPSDKTSGEEIEFSDLKVFKDVIEEVSDNIYLYNRIDYNTNKIQDTKGKILSIWKCKSLNLFRFNLDNKTCSICANELSSYLVKIIGKMEGNAVYVKNENAVYSNQELDKACEWLNEKNYKISCVGAESLNNEYSCALSSNIDQNTLIDKYCDYDALIINDFQLLKGNEDAIKYVFNIFKKMAENDKSVIIFSSCDIEEIDQYATYNFNSCFNKYIVE